MGESGIAVAAACGQSRLITRTNRRLITRKPSAYHPHEC